MKTHSLILLLYLVVCSSSIATAQEHSEFETRSIPSSILQVSDLMTTHLVFPQPIKSVDRGSRNILVQKAKEVTNILQVKAENSDLPNSNLTVITEDGGFYSFTVSYEQSPENLNLRIQPSPRLTKAGLTAQAQTSSQIRENAQLISLKHRSIPAIRQRKYLTGMALTGIFIESDLFYFQLELENQSNIAYDVALFKFFIRDNKQNKRSASQELEQTPKLIWGDSQRIPAQSTQTLVVVLPKFTLPNQQHLGIELMEQQGGRNLTIKVKNRHLMQAMVLN